MPDMPMKAEDFLAKVVNVIFNVFIQQPNEYEMRMMAILDDLEFGEFVEEMIFGLMSGDIMMASFVAVPRVVRLAQSAMKMFELIDEILWQMWELEWMEWSFAEDLDRTLSKLT